MTASEWLEDMAATRLPAWWYPGIQVVLLEDNAAARKYAPEAIGKDAPSGTGPRDA